MAHYGTCPGDNSNGGCPACSAVEYDPVCGINGQTYPNMCESNCRQASNSMFIKVRLVNAGETKLTRGQIEMNIGKLRKTQNSSLDKRDIR